MGATCFLKTQYFGHAPILTHCTCLLCTFSKIIFQNCSHFDFMMFFLITASLHLVWQVSTDAIIVIPCRIPSKKVILHFKKYFPFQKVFSFSKSTVAFQKVFQLFKKYFNFSERNLALQKVILIFKKKSSFSKSHLAFQFSRKLANSLPI